MSAPERLCVACGRTVAIPCRFDPVPDCPSPDACTLDMTTDEAWQYWRGVAHEQRTVHAAAVQRAAEDARRAALEEAARLVDPAPNAKRGLWAENLRRKAIAIRALAAQPAPSAPEGEG